MGPASEAKVAQISHTVTLNRLLDMGPACQRHTPLFNILQTSPYNFTGTPFNQKTKSNQHTWIWAAHAAKQRSITPAMGLVSNGAEQ